MVRVKVKQGTEGPCLIGRPCRTKPKPTLIARIGAAWCRVPEVQLGLGLGLGLWAWLGAPYPVMTSHM